MFRQWLPTEKGFDEILRINTRRNHHRLNGPNEYCKPNIAN